MVRTVLALLSFVAVVDAERLAAAEGQEIPWRKAAAVGALAAHASSGHVAGALPDSEAAAEGADSKDPADMFTSIEAQLVAQLRDHHLPDEAVVGKLVESLRRRGMDRRIAEELEADLRHHGLERLKFPEAEPWWSTSSDEPLVEQFAVLREDGSSGFLFKRYFAREQRGPDEVRALQNLLRSIGKPKTKDMFLQVLAQSHDHKDIAHDQDGEVMLMFQPFLSTLREYMIEHQYEITFNQRMKFFSRALQLVQSLHKRHIPHNSVITPDSILVTLHPSIPQQIELVLCASILKTEITIDSAPRRLWSWLSRAELLEQTVRSNELFDSDVRQLGDLLKHLLGISWSDRIFTRVQVMYAFADALQAGAFPGKRGAMQELNYVMDTISLDGVSDERLAGLQAMYIDMAQTARAARESAASPGTAA